MNIETFNLGDGVAATRCLEAKTALMLSQSRFAPACILNQVDCSAIRHAALDLPGDLDPAPRLGVCTLSIGRLVKLAASLPDTLHSVYHLKMTYPSHVMVRVAGHIEFLLEQLEQLGKLRAA